MKGTIKISVEIIERQQRKAMKTKNGSSENQQN